jgi:hypothetical protein
MQTRLTFGIEALHEGFKHVQFVGDGEIDKVGVHQNAIRGPQAFVVGKEEGSRGLRSETKIKFNKAEL